MTCRLTGSYTGSCCWTCKCPCKRCLAAAAGSYYPPDQVRGFALLSFSTKSSATPPLRVSGAAPLARSRLHFLRKPRLADHQKAGPRALRIPAFEPDRADAGFVQVDDGKSHRGSARITHNRAVLIEHRCSPWIDACPPGQPIGSRSGWRVCARLLSGWSYTR